MSSNQLHLLSNSYFCNREQEISQLFQEFELMSISQSRITMIYGEAGIGKSILIQKLKELLTIQPTVLFATGKFDQLQFNSPYSALIQIFNQLIEQIINSEKRELFAKALKQHDQLYLLVPLMPTIVKLIDIPNHSDLSISLENQNRFYRALDQFLDIFFQHHYELVIVLDDVHWIDQSTLNILNYLFIDRIKPLKHCFLIMTARSNHENKNVSLVENFIDIFKNHFSEFYFEMYLSLFNQSQIRELLDCIFIKARQPNHELATVAYHKTGGNPFFIMQFVSHLISNRLIQFDESYQVWDWNIEHIMNQKITDNVVDLVLNNIKHLPETTKNILIMASCLGNTFELKMLSDLMNMNLLDLIHELTPSIEFHLVLEHNQISYKFSHDKIQQSFYDLLNEFQRQEYHYKIGKYLYSNIPKYQRYERASEIVDHINLSKNLIQDINEKTKIIELNLVSARKAKNKTAYGSALNYIKVSYDFLMENKNHWHQCHQLSFQVIKEYASIAYCNSDFEYAEELINYGLQHVDSILEKAQLYDILIAQYTSIGRYQEAIQAGLTILQYFDVHIDINNLNEQFLSMFYEIHELLKNKSTRSLLNLPKNDNEEFKYLAIIVKKLGITCYIAHTHLFRVLSLILLKRFLREGYTAESSIDYACYGVFLSMILENHTKAYKYGDLALKLSDKFKGEARHVTLFLHATHLHHWGAPLRYSIELYREIYQDSIRIGDVQFACYGMLHEILVPFYAGVNLEEIDRQFHDMYIYMMKYRNYWGLALILGFKLVIYNLRNQSSDMLNFDCPDYQMTEEQYFEQFNASDTGTVPFAYLLIKAETLYIYNQYDLSLKILQDYANLLPIVEGLHLYIDYHFYLGLNLSQFLLNQAHQKELLNQEYLDQFKSIIKQFNKWQKVQDNNFKHRYLLLKAEESFLNRKYSEALKYYDSAIESAKQNEYHQIYAIACERAGRFWFHQSKLEFAIMYLEKALKGYEIWGATRKVNQLTEEILKLK